MASTALARIEGSPHARSAVRASGKCAIRRLSPLAVGDAESVTHEGYTIGLVSDILEMDDGYNMYEVIFEQDRGWFSDLELEVISEV